MEDFNKKKEVIGQGKIAKVYLYNNFAYKVFDKAYPKEWIDYEIGIQNEISKLNLPVVNYYESEIPNSIKMDYIRGITLADRVRKEKYKDSLEDLFNLFSKIHKVKEVNLPKLTPYLIESINKVNCSEDIKDKALKYISEIEEGNSLCHLDYHFLNIMYSEDRYYIIDWMNAKIGNPVYDFARTYVIMYEFANRLSKKFLKIIQERCSFSTEDLNKAIYVIALHRLTEFKSEKVELLINKMEF